MKLFGLLTLMALLFASPQSAPAQPRIGGPAPEITGVDVTGKPLKLSQFKGKVVRLDFWGDR